MSVVSSVLSTRSSGWKISARLSSFMDSIFAIAFGLGLRVVVDGVSHQNFKLTGTLVGLWEGIILLHFLKKMPKSTDPYVAYGVRLFVDFLLTDSVARLLLVLIWTALGMVLADITPAIWDDVGLNRIWRHFRRDIYTMTQMIPTVAFFPPPRTVRFSPSREPSVIIEEPSVLDTETPSVVTTEQTLTTPIDVPTTTATTSAVHRRRVPGHFSAGFSDTDTDLGSVRAGLSTGRTSRRLSVYPDQQDYEDSVTELSSNNDLDEANLSSGGSSMSTERGEPSSMVVDPVSIPDMEEEETPLVLDTVAAAAAAIKHEEGDQTTPRAAPMYLPPTPSDSAVRWRPNLEPEEPLPIRLARPLAESLPQIPDFLEEPTTEDWENIQPQEYADKPPTPPAKDDLPARFAVPPVPTMAPPQPPQIVPPSATAPAPAAPVATAAIDDDWETLKGNFVAPADLAAAASGTGTEKRRSEPPSYKESAEFDDIYGEEYVPEPRIDEPVPNDIYNNATGAPPPTNLLDDADVSSLGAPFTYTFGPTGSKNPWAGSMAPAADGLDDFARQLQEDEARLQRERDARAAEEKEEKERLEAEAAAAEAEAKRVLEVQEAEAKRKQEEEDAEKERAAQEKRRKREEKEERKRKEEADELVRQQKRDEEAAEMKRVEAEEAERKLEERKKRIEEKKLKKAAEAEAKKVEEVEAARVAAEAKRLEEEEVARKLEEKRKRVEEKKLKKAAEAEAKKAEEAEAARVAAEEEEKKKEEAAAQRRKDAEEAAARRQAAQDAKEAQEAKEEAERQAAAAQAAHEAKEKELEDAETARVAQAAVDAALAAETQTQTPTPTQEEQAAVSTPEGADETHPPPADNSGETQGADDAPTTPKNHSQPLDAEENSGEGQKTPVVSHQALDAPVERSAEPPAPTDPVVTHNPEAEADATQTGEERAPGSPEIAESVISEASEVPSKVAERLDRTLLLKAQMIETEDIIERLKEQLADPEKVAESLTEELKRTEKILKKMQKKEQRRYESGVAEHSWLDANDNTDSLTFGTQVTPIKAGMKTQEKLEELLKPGVNSLNLSLYLASGAKKNSNGAKQKDKVTEILQEHGLFDYTRGEINNGRNMHVKVPEEQFRKWLVDYRAKQTAAKEEDNNWQYT